jgi:Tol biopolymer transport system component
VSGVLSRGHAHVYSATNGRIAYSLFDQTTDQVYSINADGSGQQQLTNDTFFSLEPVWSPDGSKIAYVSDVNNDGNAQILIMHSDGSNKVNLTNDANVNFDPQWSPDGTKIAFGVTPSGGGNTGIVVMNADGSGQHQITNGTSDSTPSWKPDGSSIIYTCWDGSHDQLCLVNPDGTNQSQFTNDPHAHQRASWSPGGTKILFIYAPTLYDNHIATMNPDGTNLQLLPTTGTNTNDPSWSPDGTKILFDDSGVGSSSQSMYYMNSDGTGETAITPDDGFYSSFGSWQPVQTTDNDNDGSVNTIENSGPNSGDSNGDSIPDATQPNVTSLIDPITSKYAVLQSSCGSSTGVSITPAPAAYKDSAFSYPEGLFSFTLHCGIAGATAIVSQYYYGLPVDSTLVLRKYNATTHAYQTMPAVTITSATIGGQPVAKATYQITDGGLFDQDGVADGVIVDPVGIARPSIGAPNTGLGGTAR